MTSGGRTLQVTFVGDADDAIRAMRSMNRELGRTDDATQRASRSTGVFSTGLGGLRAGIIGINAAAVATGIGIYGLANAMGSAVSAATSAVETQSKLNTVFGESSAALTSWSETSATAFGLSQQAAQAAAGDFGNMFSQLGIGLGVSADMSMQMVELAADFASFHNADITDVLTAQAAAFRGEYDAVQRFVPVINAAAVEERAMEMGLAATTTGLTQQDKALATHALLIEGAGDATGDFARTSEGLANQQRILTAQIDDLQATIGAALLPVVTDVVSGVSDWISRNDELLSQDVPAAIEAMTQAGEDLWAILNEIANFPPIQLTVEIITVGGELIAQLMGGTIRLGSAAREQGGNALGDLRAALGSLGSFGRGAPGAIQSLMEDTIDIVNGRMPSGIVAQVGSRGAARDERAGRIARNQAEADRVNRIINNQQEAARANALIDAYNARQGGGDWVGDGMGAGKPARGGGGRGGGGSALSKLEEEALATTGKVRELADALVARTGISLVDAIKRVQESLALTAERELVAVQKAMDEAAASARAQKEAADAVAEAELLAAEAARAAAESFGTLIQSMGQSSFWQGAGGGGNHAQAAADLIRVAEEVARINAGMGLDPLGRPLAGTINNATIVVEGSPDGTVAVLDSVTR